MLPSTIPPRPRRRKDNEELLSCFLGGKNVILNHTCEVQKVDQNMAQLCLHSS